MKKSLETYLMILVYIKYIWFGLVGYLMSNPFYTFILNVGFLNTFYDNNFKQAWVFILFLFFSHSWMFSIKYE